MHIYPTSGSEVGGTTITFLYAIQNSSIAGDWPPQGKLMDEKQNKERKKYGKKEKEKKGNKEM
jgi:hypothetical protein